MADTGSSPDDYEMSTCFPMAPGLSTQASNLSSRRSSVVSLGSSYSVLSFSTDHSPLSPSTPVSLQLQSSSKEQKKPPNSGCSLLQDALDPDPSHLYTLPDSSVGETFGCGELKTEFADLTAGWECHYLDQNTSPKIRGFWLFPGVDPHFPGQTVANIQPDYSGVHDIIWNSPPTVLPSQTLICLNPSTLALATPVVCPQTRVKFQPYSSYLNQSPDSLSLDYEAENESVRSFVTPHSCRSNQNISKNDSLFLQENKLMKSLEDKASRKHQKKEDICDDGDPNSKRVINIPVTKVTRVEKNAEKPNQCHICRKGFDRREHLTRHNRTEGHRNMQKKNGLTPTPQTKYVCVFCKSEFTRSDNLKPHLLTHMRDGGLNSKTMSVTEQEVKDQGLEKMDPRRDQGSGLRKESNEKARTKKRR